MNYPYELSFKVILVGGGGMNGLCEVMTEVGGGGGGE